jgi:hypothetical protein
MLGVPLVGVRALLVRVNPFHNLVPGSISLLIRIAVGWPLRAQQNRSADGRRNSEADVQATSRIDCCAPIAAAQSN